MPRLQKSIDKCNALLKATLQLINNGGIQGASMAKVASLANVSPATIYLYYTNKQDLVNQLYLEVKTAYTTKSFEDLEISKPVKLSFEKIWFNMAEYKMKNKEEASFLSQCDNSPIIDEYTKQAGLKLMQPLFDLWRRGQDEGIIKDISPYLLYAFTIYPMAFLMNTRNKNMCHVDEDILEKAFQVAWDSIKV